jgi:hypothetical protein
MDQEKKDYLEGKARVVLKVLEANQIAISQLSFDLGEIKKNYDVKLTLLNLDLKDLRDRFNKLEGELESLFKK